MNIEEIKKIIITLIENSNDYEYILAVYSFAENYPDNSKKN